MLKVRLQRVGRKNDPSFRVVVTDSKRGPRSGDYIEMVGSHNPRTKETAIKSERIHYWTDKGAQLSPTVHNILVKKKIIEGKPVNVLPRKSPVGEADLAKKAESKDSPRTSDGEASEDEVANTEKEAPQTPEIQSKEAGEGEDTRASAEDSEKGNKEESKDK